MFAPRDHLCCGADLLGVRGEICVDILGRRAVADHQQHDRAADEDDLPRDAPLLEFRSQHLQILLDVLRIHCHTL